MILTILPFEVMLSAGAATVKGVLAGTQNMYINPLFPPLVLESFLLLCCENLSELRPPLE